MKKTRDEFRCDGKTNELPLGKKPKEMISVFTTELPMVLVEGDYTIKGKTLVLKKTPRKKTEIVVEYIS